MARRIRAFNRALAIGLASLLSPMSLAALALCAWRIGADLNLTGQFAFANGVLSHWQVWLAIGILLQAAAIALSRVGGPTDYDSDNLAA